MKRAFLCLAVSSSSTNSPPARIQSSSPEWRPDTAVTMMSARKRRSCKKRTREPPSRAWLCNQRAGGWLECLTASSRKPHLLYCVRPEQIEKPPTTSGRHHGEACLAAKKGRGGEGALPTSTPGRWQSSHWPGMKSKLAEGEEEGEEEASLNRNRRTVGVS